MTFMYTSLLIRARASVDISSIFCRWTATRRDVCRDIFVVSVF